MQSGKQGSSTTLSGVKKNVQKDSYYRDLQIESSHDRGSHAMRDLMLIDRD